jgi:hypothetical protein
MRSGLMTIALVLVAPVLAACSSGNPESTDRPSGGASASSAPPAPAAPTVGACHELSLAEAT